ncbi:YgiT-type zinc finger protein [Longimicrobium sp.]
MPYDDHAVDRLVTYSVEYEGRIIIVENVPARVDPKPGSGFTRRKP